MFLFNFGVGVLMNQPPYDIILTPVTDPATGSPAVPGTWNPNDKHADFTLSNGDLTATKSGTTEGTGLVRATKSFLPSIATGRYVEISYDAVPSSATTSFRLGLATAAGPKNASLGSTAGSGISFASSGTVTVNGALGTPSSAVTYQAGDVIGLLLKGNKLWMRRIRAGVVTQLSGHDMAAGTGGWDLSSFAVELFPAIASQVGGAGSINTGASAFAAPLPSGAQAWGGIAAVPSTLYNLSALPITLAPGATIATVSGLDPDPGHSEALTFNMVDANNKFTLSGNQLKVVGVPAQTIVTATTWNPSDKAADITLSNNNLTASKTGTASSFGVVRATKSHLASNPEGRYFEITWAGNPFLSSQRIGVYPPTAGAGQDGTLTNHVGTSGGFAWFEGGYSWTGGSVSTGGLDYAAGDVIGILLKAGKIYSRRSRGGTITEYPGQNWAAETGGIDISSITTPLFPAFSSDSTPTVMPTLATESFAMPLPANAQAWGPTTVTIPASSGLAYSTAYPISIQAVDPFNATYTEGFTLGTGAKPLVSAYVTGDRRSAITATTNIVKGSTADHTSLLNGNTTESTYYWNSAQTSGYLRFDFAVGTVVQGFKWYADTGTSEGTWKLQGSNDAVSWTDIGASFSLIGSPTGTEYLFSNTTAYRHHQLVMVSGTTSNVPFLREIEFKVLA